MDNIFKYGFFILIVLVISVWMFKGRSDKEYIKELETQEVTLNEKILRLEADNRRIITNLALKTDSILVLRSEYTILDEEKPNAEYHEERINDYNRFFIVQLDSSFTKRYSR